MSGKVAKSAKKRSRNEDSNSDDDMSGNEMSRAILQEVKKLRKDLNAKSIETNQTNAIVDARLNMGMVGTARVMEEMDGVKNYLHRNMVVLRQCIIPNGFVMPRVMKDKAEAIRILMLEQLAKLPAIQKTDVTVSSVFIFRVGATTTTFPDFRMTCGSNDDATEVKFRILAARETGQGIWSGCDVSSDTVKATRVRIAILSAIARELRVKEQDVSVNRFIDSPTLIIRKDSKIVKQLTYVDAVLEYGELVSPDDIARARRIAGQTMKGQLEQAFLIIKEIGVSHNIPVPCGTYTFNAEGQGRGRGSRGRGGRGARGYGRGSNFTAMGQRRISTSGMNQQIQSSSQPTFSQVVSAANQVSNLNQPAITQPNSGPVYTTLSFPKQ